MNGFLLGATGTVLPQNKRKILPQHPLQHPAFEDQQDIYGHGHHGSTAGHVHDHINQCDVIVTDVSGLVSYAVVPKKSSLVVFVRVFRLPDPTSAR